VVSLIGAECVPLVTGIPAWTSASTLFTVNSKHSRFAASGTASGAGSARR
jgi:hypothetical protein